MNKNFTIRGGKYTARLNGDGTYDLLDFPIFGELDEWERWNPKRIERKWHEAAVAMHALRAAEDFVPPAHYRHTGPVLPTEPMGKFLPKRVDTVRYGGKPVSCVRSDVYGIPERMFKRIESGEIQYCSVEVSDWDRPEFSALAFLSEAPHFKFPNITIGAVVEGEEQAAYQFSALGGRTEDGRAVFCFSAFEDITMTKPGATTPATPPASPAPAPAEQEKPPAWFQAAMEQMVKPMVEKFMTEHAKGIAGTPAPIPPAATATKKDGPIDPKDMEIAERDARIAALEAAQRRRDDRDAFSARFEKAKQELGAYHLGTADLETLQKFAEMGEQQLAMFVKHFKDRVPVEPASHLTAFLGTLGNEPEELKQFTANKGPAELKRARELWPGWVAYQKGGGTAVKTFSDYMSINGEQPATVSAS